MPHQCDCTLDDQELEVLNWGGFRRQVVYTKFNSNLSFIIHDVSICHIKQGTTATLTLLNKIFFHHIKSPASHP